MDKINDLEIFDEILASDRLGAWQGFGNGVTNVFGDDPTILWENIKWNPWAAMAIFEDMEDKDATLFSCLEKRRDGVLDLPRFVKAASDSAEDKRIAAFVEETLESYWGGDGSTFDDESIETPFESFLSEALDAVGDGVTIGEIIFKEASDRIYIEQVKFKPQHLFSFGGTGFADYSTSMMLYPHTGHLCLRSGVSAENFGLGEKLPENKFFVFSYRPRKSNRWGSPAKRKVFWHTWIKRAAAKGWLRYIDKGAGTIVARYNDGAAADEQATAVDAATAVQEENAVAIPKKFILEVHEMVRNIGSSHKELVDDYCNAEISRAIVGQTLTGRGSDGGGSRALGEVHERVESKKVANDAKALMAAVNRRIVRPLVLYKFGPKAKLPVWSLELELQEGLNSKAERFGNLRKDVGMPLSKAQIREAFQLDEPKDEADTLGGTPEVQSPESVVQGKQENKDKADFSEKKTKKSDAPSSLKTERFQRLRPSMIRFSDE
jgi:phage gp29-like protein